MAPFPEASDIRTELIEIANLNSRARPKQAEERLRDLLEAIEPADIEVLQSQIREAIWSFLPKKRKALDGLLDELLRKERRLGPFELQAFLQGTANRLADLADRRIFQWDTSYRAALQLVFGEALAILRRGGSTRELCPALRQALHDHARLVFERGFEFSTEKLQADSSTARAKCLRGLRAFLALPLDQYLIAAPSRRTSNDALHLRCVSSAMISGVLTGAMDALLGNSPFIGDVIDSLQLWIGYLPLLTARDLVDLLDRVKAEPLHSELMSSVLVEAKAIEVAQRTTGNLVFLPTAVSVTTSPETDCPYIDTSIVAPASRRTIRIRVYVGSARVGLDHLADAHRAGARLVLAPIDVRDQTQVDHNPTLRMIVVNTDAETLPERNPAELAGAILANAVAIRLGDGSSTAPLVFNYARQFPIDSPVLPPSFLVPRPSVMKLLRDFERASGIQLWCSVRRSGKTTACFELPDVSGPTQVLSQTCQEDHRYPGADRLIRAVKSALGTGEQLPNDFLDSVLAGMSPQHDGTAGPVLLIVDEYETLFEILRFEGEESRRKRYYVVQPFLNQLVEFSRQNVLVFVGQRPDAHFILMDQNPLSPYVRQGTFPLFSHGSEEKSEFRELLLRIMTDQAELDPTFSRAIYAETSGHPYLTVNLLNCFVDWLIERRWPASRLRFSEQEFSDFGKSELLPSALARNPEYKFFHRACGEALSEAGRKNDPWLHAVYGVLRHLAREHPADFTASEKEVLAALAGSGVPTDQCDDLLRTAARANFLLVDDSAVKPRIRLLARICSTSAAASWR